MFYERSFGFVQSCQRVAFDSGAFHTFDRSQDLFGDGSVRLLPTPGHTPGHLCALVDMGGYQLLVTGDCLYTLGTSRHGRSRPSASAGRRASSRPSRSEGSLSLGSGYPASTCW